jgi:hypothetical protein
MIIVSQDSSSVPESNISAFVSDIIAGSTGQHASVRHKVTGNKLYLVAGLKYMIPDYQRKDVYNSIKDFLLGATPYTNNVKIDTSGHSIHITAERS